MDTDRDLQRDFDALAGTLVQAMDDAAGASGPGGPSVSTPWPEARFEDLALRVFRYQFAWNPVYRAFCDGRGRTPDAVEHWSDIPAVPAAAFKALDLTCGAPEDAEAVFRTSGTTRGGTRRGTHHVRSLALYHASLLPTFRRHVVPEDEPLPFVSLIPSPDAVPDSSLSHMVGAAADACAASVAWVMGGDGQLDRAGLARALGDATGHDAPVLLLGTAFAFAHALDDARDAFRHLPEGSRIMETGGFKGRTRSLSAGELHGRLSGVTGVPRERIVNEYGMTELLSQLYEPVLGEGLAGVGVHVPPPWLRVRALDPETLEPVQEGGVGILAFMDLANLGSISHILTEDVGTVVDGRVRLVGRAPGAEPRGCSRAMDELMSSVR